MFQDVSYVVVCTVSFGSSRQWSVTCVPSGDHDVCVLFNVCAAACFVSSVVAFVLFFFVCLFFVFVFVSVGVFASAFVYAFAFAFGAAASIVRHPA